MKKLFVLTTLILCFVQSAAFAGTTLNVKLQFEIPDYVRVEKKEHKIHKQHQHNDRKSDATKNRNDFVAIAEVPEVDSNCRWNMVVMKGDKVFFTEIKSDITNGTNEAKFMEDIDNHVADTVAGSWENDLPSKNGNQTGELQLSYTFFAD
jgi:hypothetical protein